MLNFIEALEQKNPKAWAQLQEKWKKGTDFLGCPLAILGGAMTWVSESHFVSTISNTGGFGVLACGAMPPESLRAEIQATRQKTTHPFGVNLILLHPQLDALIQICIEEKVSHVVFAGGLPLKNQIASLTRENIRVIGFAPALILAKKLIRSGIDALIIEGSEAGGHIGPVSTSVLAQEILPEIQDVPVFVAGGIGRGQMMSQYLNMKASGVQLGTLLVCAEESLVHPRFKEAFLRAQARDAVVSPQIDPRFPVIPVRALSNLGMTAFLEKQREIIQRFEQGELTQKEGQLEIEHFWSGALRRAVKEGDIETGSLMAGQSVGLIKEIQPLRAILESFLEETLESMQEQTLS